MIVPKPFMFFLMQLINNSIGTLYDGYFKMSRKKLNNSNFFFKWRTMFFFLLINKVNASIYKFLLKYMMETIGKYCAFRILSRKNGCYSFFFKEKQGGADCSGVIFLPV